MATEAPVLPETPAVEEEAREVVEAAPVLAVIAPAAAIAERIGSVQHYYPHVGVGVVRVESGELRTGDRAHFRGHTTDFCQQVERMEVEHRAIEVARPGDTVAIKVGQRVRAHDRVFRVSD